MAREGKRVPTLENRPELKEELQPVLDLFYLCSQSRPYSMSGPGPIPLSEIVAVLDLYGYSNVETRVGIVRLVQAADSEWLNYASRSSEKGKGNADGSSSSGRTAGRARS